MLLQKDMKEKFIVTVSKGDMIGAFPERVVAKKALSAYAKEVYGKSLGRTLGERSEAYKKCMSSFAGEAELRNIEADFGVLNIYRDIPAIDFAQIRPLPLGEIPLFRVKFKNYVNITMGSLAGGVATGYYANRELGQQVRPFTFSTEKQMVPNLNNLYDMSKLAERKDALEREDHALKVIQTNIAFNAAFANSKSVNLVSDDPAVSITNYAADGGSFSGKNVYELDPGVIANSVPTVNYYDLSATENGLTKKVFQTIRTHSIQIGRTFSKMYIPTAATSGKSPVWEALQNLATPVALITGTVGSPDPAAAVPQEMWSEFQKDDFSGSVVVNWFGQTTTVTKQNWLPAGYLVLFAEEEDVIVMWDRLELESGQGAGEGIFEAPVDAFYCQHSRAKNVAVARPDLGLRNLLLLRVNA